MKIKVEIGCDALNDAGWDFVRIFPGHLTGHQFNNIKGCLHVALETYLNKELDNFRAGKRTGLVISDAE